MSTLEKYLIAVNIIGFLMYFINFLLYKFTSSANVDNLLTILSLAGGSLGIFVFIVLFDRKSVKENMMSRVFLICVLIIQIIILLFIKGFHGEELNFAFWEFFGKYKILIVYLAIINFITFAAFAIDKIHAIEGKSRIRILTLLGLAFMGGSVGALLGIYILRHKTKVDYFTVGIPLIMVMQGVVVFFVMNFKG
ncbi:hypothetical protein GCWU000282_02307 [Catonella morbi ATCC 51271]|jgi:hypothetical protein|uniref:DUF1294 domain-containing protein n=1 Tax=Catonella morbi ATCC 51271 TaxID=592026 RepID=V2XZP2_9FIRM|nr:DUF1294 domain-containing protein [Catonella morbi]ESL02173.1 hypothetical protein GCWU000282_02307 [Catonella morbi ATCC 51271]